ncbi:MAG: alpha/beta hydrolase [Myxococcota bacterium]
MSNTRCLGILLLGTAACGSGAAEATIGTDGGTMTGSASESGAGAETPGAEGSSSGAASGSGDSGAGSGDSGETSGSASCPAQSRRDVEFSSLSGVDPNLTSLDVFPVPAGSPAPVVVFVHGGGWKIGDKTSHESNPEFLQFFHDEGFALASVNYRLIGDPGSPNADWSAQPTDVAAGVAWLVDHADELCIDAGRIALMGHSAGAHIVALLASDATYLDEHGIGFAQLSGVVPLDVNAYDIPFAIDNGAALGAPGAAVNLPSVFGDDPDEQWAASPISHVSASAGHPPFFIVWAPIFGGAEQMLSQAASDRFAAELEQAGAAVTVLGSLDDDHTSLASELGRPGDEPTEDIRMFLQSL